ncbi:uncharacterized protein CDV56_104501 [Aspergillus thermomutatus]|uniref:Isopropylmalate dehydrogenase-like domain-containing protein n=1 Tax=Aspergillus thermomutatus TaxID=41047 RepID=A0A397GP41_ASPTH|nr:uncharacterized protein CDV56_104501 [Aspergillus thermomutatus]RHZ50793.1 hypothetical protein CDV56_104501 [Aspergillus thermomutatus]
MSPSQAQAHRTFKVTLLPGDGAGPQLASHAKKVLGFIQQVRPNLTFDISEHQFGGAAIAAGAGSAPPRAALQACLDSDAVILCGCGDPQFGVEPVTGSLDLHKELGIFANIQPVFFPSTGLVQQSSFKYDGVQRLDITFISDATSGISYRALKEADSEGQAHDTTEYSRETIERVARWAGAYAMQFHPPKPVHSVDESSPLATSPVWRSVVTEVFENEFPQVPLRYVLVDTAATLLASEPTRLNGIVLTTSKLGETLSDQAGGIVGSQDILASAAVSTPPRKGIAGMPGIFKPRNLNARRDTSDPLCILPAVSLMLDLSFGLVAEAAALTRAIRRTLDPIELLGSNIRTAGVGGLATPDEFMGKLLEHLDYYLEAASAEAESRMSRLPREPSVGHPVGKRRPMGVIEKIMTNAAVGLSKPEVQTGEIICVQVDWTLTSEILWAGMEKTYDRMGRPRPYRNDRMWLAIDHTVDPRTNHRPRQRSLIEKAEKFRREAKIIDFLPANTSILHTDFTRERAQPGRIIVGCDSHSCSAGCMGALAVGLGAADVVMPMVTGETWFRVPEVCRINFVGKLPFGIGGKDVILHILGLFKRNTIAFQRAVEYGGPGLKELSMDARFAIANMTTEFGGMGACFEADENTAEWISRRPHPEHREGGLYFKADPDAQYAEVRTVDLSDVGFTIALYPDPDHVVAVTEKVGMKLDGCFIGACTTTEEDLIVGALVLEAGLRAGMVPASQGRRRVTPGSLSIIKNLERHGVLDIYRQAGFNIGAPGCSYCVGINDVDVAGEGEVWLSSQNRNFRNRMGKGSFGSITCAAVVAASSFGMVVTDPRPLLSQIDKGRLNRILGSQKVSLTIAPETSEPDPVISSHVAPAPVLLDSGTPAETATPTADTTRTTSEGLLRSRVQRFGENVDTDAIIPAEFVPGVDNADLGNHCFQYYRPEFRKKAEDGSRIIVADRGFGSGSSREDAVRALQGAGIEAVIAPSFAFIYDRNQLNMGLFNITLPDAEFYAHAKEDSVVIIDQNTKTVQIEGIDRVFRYQQSEMEKTLLDAGGVLPLYSQFGRTVFRQIANANSTGRMKSKSGAPRPVKLDW